MSWSFGATKSKTDMVQWIMSEEVFAPTYIKDFICAALAHLTTDENAMVRVESSGHLAGPQEYGPSRVDETYIELVEAVTEAKADPAPEAMPAPHKDDDVAF